MANGHGGARPGAGRAKGGANKITEEAIKKAKAGGIMPLDFMLDVMRDAEAADDVRMDAAKASAPYVHAKLSSIAIGGDIDSTVTHKVSEKDAALVVGRIDKLLESIAGVGADSAAEDAGE